MGWKVRITSITPAANARIDSIAALLSKLPGLSEEQAKKGLKTPPLDLPIVKTEADAQKLAQGLLKMGLICKIQAAIVPVANAPAPAPASTPAQPRAHRSIFDLEDEISKGVPIELRDIPLSTLKPAHFRPNRSQIILISILLVFIVFALVIRSCVFSPTTLKTDGNNALINQESPADSIKNIKNKARAQRSESLRRQDRQRHEQALQQMSKSEQLLREAEMTPDTHKSAEILSKALELNPFNLESWTQLAAKYRRMGDEKRAVECEIAYVRNDRYQKTLEGIAKYFGGTPKAHLTVARVSFTVSDDTLSSKSFHQKTEALYDTVHTLHPEKEFEVDKVGKDSLKLLVMPGDTFPNFDSWDELNRKAKTN